MTVKQTLRRHLVAAITLLTAIIAAVPAYCDDITETRKPHFAWGANLSGNVDMSDHNMSAIGINAEVGMRWKWIRFIGFGAEGNMMVSNSDRCFPLYVNFRTDFSSRRRLLFVDLRGGVTLNYFDHDKQNAEAYASGGVGITLAAGKTFSSHLIVAYTYIGNDNCFLGNISRPCPGISLATLRLGVAF